MVYPYLHTHFVITFYMTITAHWCIGYLLNICKTISKLPITVGYIFHANFVLKVIESKPNAAFITKCKHGLAFDFFSR